MLKISTYKDGSYPFPSTNIDPKLKLEPEYCRDWAEAIFALYQNNATNVGVDTVSYFSRMLQYSEGNQDTNQYKSFIKNEDTTEDANTGTSVWDDNLFTKEAKRSGYHALVFQNLSPAAKIMNSLHGLMDKLDYDILADTIDADSRGLIEFMKYKQFHEAKDAKWQMEFKKKAGIPVDEPTNFPKTKEELDAFEAREGFKLNVAKSMQKLLRYSFHDSAWDSVVRKKVLDDLICTKYGATLDYFDDETQTFKVMWLDPAKTIMQFSDEFDYSDSEYGGYFDSWSISNIRRKRPDLKEEELISLAKSYKGKLGNPSKWQERFSHLDPATKRFGCDDWKVLVLRAFWIDTDEHKSVYFKGKGTGRYTDIAHDYKPTPLTKNQKEKGYIQELKSTSIRQVYQCHWVVDSDICFDYGKYYMSARPKMTKPKLPLHVEQLLQPSIIYRLIPILDHIAITWLQFQNDLANMVQRGYAINMAMLMNITMNGKDLDPASVLTMWKQKGLLPYMLSPNGQYGGGMALPITPIEGGLGARVEETMMALQMYYKSIEDIVGINPLALGASPDPNAPVSTSEAALRATSNVLKPVLDAMFEIKESVAVSLCDRIQIGLRVSDSIRKSYAGIVNPNDIKAMIMAEQSGTKYGIMLRARPDDKQRANIIRYMELAIQQGTITPSDAMYFSERIESGADITEIRQEMAYAIDKMKQQEQEFQQQNIKAQNDGLMAIEQSKAENTAKQSVLETQGKILEEQARGTVKKEVLTAEQNYELLNRTMDGMMAEKGLTANTTSK